MKSPSSSLSVSVLIAVVIIGLAIGAGSIVHFDNLLIANAQSSQSPTVSQSATPQEEAIVRQGTVTSSQNPLPGHEEEQRATILPLTQDGSIYSGVLTYTATEPVSITILNVQNLNETEQAILNTPEDGEFGTLLTAQLDNQTGIAITQITPEYGDAAAPSASIPFAGNAVWLHTLSGEPFAATFVVSAHVLPAEIQNNINNFTEISDVVSPEGDVGDAEDTDIGNDIGVDTEGATEEEEVEETEDATATATTDDDNVSPTGANNNGENDNDGGNNEEVIVRIPQGSSSFTDDAYAPNPVEVNTGSTVTWVNDDFTSHTATSGTSNSGSTGMFGGTDDSPEIIGPEGDSQSFTFDEAGEFEYYCTLHPSMVGTVVVTEG